MLKHDDTILIRNMYVEFINCKYKGDYPTPRVEKHTREVPLKRWQQSAILRLHLSMEFGDGFESGVLDGFFPSLNEITPKIRTMRECIVFISKFCLSCF